MNNDVYATKELESGQGPTRRRFLGYVLAAPTLLVAAELGTAGLGTRRAEAAIPSTPQLAEYFDATEVFKLATAPTANLIAIQLNPDGTASFALPRCEVGQGITTSTAMLIAEELDLPVDRVSVGLADARPELVIQTTGGSSTTATTFTPVRVAAAIARQRLVQAASIELGQSVSALRTKAGMVISSVTGESLPYGELATKAASAAVEQVPVTLKPRSEFKVIGQPQTRIDALDAVTGRKTFALDLHVPGAKPTMVCRAPTINGTVRHVGNTAEVQAMPGVTDVVVIPTGVAVRAETFGQCIDAIRALRVDWAPGTAEGKSDDTVLRELRAAQLPMTVPNLPVLAETVDAEFSFAFASNSALEPQCAVADVGPGRAEIWAPLKTPIAAQNAIAQALGLPQSAVTVHVEQGGGSFGRKLFWDAALEAALVSKAVGKPVKLMWHRTDECRQGRTHPMCTSRVRASYAAGNVLAYEQRHTSMATDFSHGMGDVLTAAAVKLPLAGLGFSEMLFQITQYVPYNFGAVTQLLNEVDTGFNTSSMRQVYSPNVACARELVVDQLAKGRGVDPYRFRYDFAKNDRARAILAKVAEAGNWGRTMTPGTAQGIAFHGEYQGFSAALVEIDCRPQTTGRSMPNAVTGPRVTKVTLAVDVGLPINPRGIEAQMMGGIMDGIALALTSSLHLKDGYFLEGSWDNYFYTRQWNTPPELDIHIMPATTDEPGGAGEFSVAPSMAAVACAYARVTGTMPTKFPINHDTLSFEPKPTAPPIPQSPTDGLKYAY